MRYSDPNVPPAAERVASLIQGDSIERYVGVLRGISARIPDHVLAEVDAMAKLSNKSRNSMIVHLLGVGLEEVRALLDADSVDRLDQSTLKAQVFLHSNFVGTDTGEI